jgi:hypothetical protein
MFVYTCFMYTLCTIYDVHVFNSVSEKLLTIQLKWIYLDYILSNIAQYIYDYTPENGQPPPKHVVF